MNTKKKHYRKRGNTELVETANTKRNWGKREDSKYFRKTRSET